MTDNPFGTMSDPSEGGGFDMQAMLEQVEQMQAQILATQDELAAAITEGTAGGVTVALSGTGELASVTITPGSFDGTDAESLADLGDLVVAAYRDGKSKVDALAAQALGQLAEGGLRGGLPGGFPGGQIGGQAGGLPGGPGV